MPVWYSAFVYFCIKWRVQGIVLTFRGVCFGFSVTIVSKWGLAMQWYMMQRCYLGMISTRDGVYLPHFPKFVQYVDVHWVAIAKNFIVCTCDIHKIFNLLFTVCARLMIYKLDFNLSISIYNIVKCFISIVL